jgi:Putative exonuclease SbcCD, C subunit
MSTIDDLTSWRVGAIEGKLPDAVRIDRWQPTRAGLVNLWEYDAAEVWYADGRMQLQGANESGKSTLLTLTTLLLLAGDTSSYNIDTLGQDGKRFRYYVEPTDHPLDRRDISTQKNRGWAWLEFGRGTEFFTLLLFAEARRADASLKVHWSTLHGQVRVRSGLSLTTAGFAADPSQFRDVPGFVQHPSGTAYREAIARILFGTEESWLNQLNRILRVVRTPQIGTKIDLKFLTDSFRIALPPIAEDEINQLADGWEQLQRLRDDRDQAEQALAVVNEFTRRSWRPWADTVIRSAADPVTAAASALTTITRDERTASDAVDGLTGEVSALEADITSKDAERRTAEARREALQDTAAYSDAVSAAANAEQLVQRTATAEETADRSAVRAEEAQDAVGPAEEDVRSAGDDLDSAERTVESIAGRVTGQAASAGLTELTAQHLPAQDVPRLRQGAQLRTAAARQAANLMSVHAAALTALETASGKAADARTRLDEAEEEARQHEGAIADAIQRIAEALSSWANGLDERLRPPSELLEAWMAQVARLTDSPAPASTLAMAIYSDHLVPVRSPYASRQASLRHELAENVKQRTSLQSELEAVEGERDPSPRGPEFWTRRDRPEGVTPVGAPFWRLVETIDDRPSGQPEAAQDEALQFEMARLEAALDAAGLLQAWVTPDGVFLPDRDGNETVWAPVSTTAVPNFPARVSLRAVLRPADDVGGLADVVERLLSSVVHGGDLNSGAGTSADGDMAGDAGSPGSGLPVGGVAVAADGRWRHGHLTGVAAPIRDGPRLLGAAARAADRARRVATLREQIAEVEAVHAILAGEFTDVEELLQMLEMVGKRLPSDTEMVSAVLAAREAAKQVAGLAIDSDRADEAERAARAKVDATAADVAGHCDEHQLPRTRGEVDDISASLVTYQDLLTRLDASMQPIESLRRALSRAETNLQGRRTVAKNLGRDAMRDRDAARDLRTQSDAAQEALSHGAQETLAEAKRLKRRVEDLDGTLRRLGDTRGELKGRLGRAQEILEQTEAKRKGAEATREMAVARWWSCVHSGLPGLRGIPEPAAHHITAALESARAARSAISIRDWPDSEHQDQFPQRVQARWMAMVDAGSDLRSKLEPLGGRSVRFIYPGDSQEDFPGGAELIVDGTGASLAPPVAADRLSDLLISLQEDYDEELTKTINELLGSTFIEHLRDRLAEAERLRGDINAKLAQNPTAISGITLRLNRVPVSEERAANDVLAALERDFELLPKPTQDRIRTFLADRITSAQEQARASGDPQWRARLAEILDYRRWFDLRLEYRTPRSVDGDQVSAGWRTLDRGDHGLLSGGAKVVTLMQPFIAALHAMYDQVGTGPRMLWLDEAFGGVDGKNKASMFRLLASCDLDWLIAGPGIIANSAAVPVAAIYEVRRAPMPFPGVSLELAVWAGNELTHVLTPDPADLRDIAATDESQDDDVLFADL